MTKVKICGIKTPEHALTAAEAGADFIGLVFTQSPRQITPGQANKIVAAIKQNQKDVPEIVGVFVNTPAYVVNRIAEFCHLDYVQLSGDETMDYFKELTPPVFKVMKISRLHKPEQLCQDLAAWSKVLSKQKHIFLLDTYDSERHGGTGQQMDWDIAKPIAEKFQVIIAGGLNAENVSEVVNKVKPWGVDVSSGVETNGEKDMNKIKAFVKAVRDADGDNKYQGANGK
jgi:phosphoribosylanthranilate isomerase